MITKRPIIHIYDIIFKDTSWELLERIRKHFAKDIKVDYLDEGYHKNENKSGFTISSPREISTFDLTCVMGLLPTWAKEIKTKEEQDEADSLKEIREWLKNTPIPEEPKKKATKDLYKVILELREELEFEANKGKVMPCGLGDLTDIMGILKLLEAGKIGQAKKSMRAMDTGAKEYIPDTCYRLMDCEDDD